MAITAVAVAARKRVHGVSEGQAKDVRAGSEVGRLELRGVIDHDAYQAAQIYMEVRNAFQRAIAAPQDFVQARPEVSGDGDFQEFVDKAVARWERLKTHVQDLCCALRSPEPWAALDYIVVKDVAVPSLENALRRTLNSLHGYFEKEKRNKRG